MKKSTKIWLITATSLMLIGCILFVSVMAMLQWDFKKLSTVPYETNTYDITDTFRSISVNTYTATVSFALSDDGRCKVVCYEESKARHTVHVQNNTLTIEINDQKAWYDHIGFHFDSPAVTVYLPEAAYQSLSVHGYTGDIRVAENLTFETVDLSSSTGDIAFHASASGHIRLQASTGDIQVDRITAGSLDLSVSTGNVTVTDVHCNGDVTVNVSTGETYFKNLRCDCVISNGDTGDIVLNNVIADNAFSIERSTGDVTLEACDAADIAVVTDTGDVTGSLLSSKVFFTDTSTGKIDVPKTTSGGTCDIRTDTGNIRITVATKAPT